MAESPGNSGPCLHEGLGFVPVSVSVQLWVPEERGEEDLRGILDIRPGLRAYLFPN